MRPSYWPEPEVDMPDPDTLEDMVKDRIDCEATDGCIVEPDGTCEHGFPSWFLYLDII